MFSNPDSPCTSDFHSSFHPLIYSWVYHLSPLPSLFLTSLPHFISPLLSISFSLPFPPLYLGVSYSKPQVIRSEDHKQNSVQQPLPLTETFINRLQHQWGVLCFNGLWSRALETNNNHKYHELISLLSPPPPSCPLSIQRQLLSCIRGGNCPGPNVSSLQLPGDARFFANQLAVPTLEFAFEQSKAEEVPPPPHLHTTFSSLHSYIRCAITSVVGGTTHLV